MKARAILSISRGFAGFFRHILVEMAQRSYYRKTADDILLGSGIWNMKHSNHSSLELGSRFLTSYWTMKRFCDWQLLFGSLKSIWFGSNILVVVDLLRMVSPFLSITFFVCPLLAVFNFFYSLWFGWKWIFNEQNQYVQAVLVQVSFMVKQHFLILTVNELFPI